MGLFSKFIAKIKGTNDFSPADWAELEQELLASDLGPTLTKNFLEAAKKVKSDNAELALIEILTSNLSKNSHEPVLVAGTTTIMVVGVNGTGKTTSVAKIASYYKKSGKSVVLAAGDTFRAGAIEQLEVWGQRVGVEVIKQQSGADPAAVMYDAVQAAKKRNVDVLLCDTAGRLQNKSNLMEELNKVVRVIQREVPDAPHEVLLVLDATTGQNALSQAKMFGEKSGVSGLVLTKLDGTAKGGIVIAIRNELKLPVKFVGLGEKMDDLQPFDAEQFVHALFSQMAAEDDADK